MKTVLFVKIGKAYYHQGFINIKKAGDEYFGKNETTASVQLKGKSGIERIEARINRTANPNETPRLMMGLPFKDWIQANCNMGDELVVKVLGKNDIMISKQPI